MPNYTYEIPSSLLTGFTLKQQTELRKIFDLAVETAIENGGGGAALKYYEEQGDATDSGTVLSDSEIVASVASLDSDMTDSGTSILLGGTENLIDTATDSALVGGLENVVSESINSVVVGGFGNDITNGCQGSVIASSVGSVVNSTVRGTILGASSATITTGATGSTIVGGENGIITSASNSVIVGGLNNAINSDALRSSVLAGSFNAVNGPDVAVVGQGASASRQGSFSVGSGTSGNGLALAMQATLISGRAATTSTTPVAIDFCSNGTLLVPANGVVGGELTLTAVRVSDLASYLFTVQFLAKRIGASTTVVVEDVVSSDGDSALATCTVNLTGTSTGVRVDVVGLAATNISWSCSGLFTEQTINA